MAVRATRLRRLRIRTAKRASAFVTVATLLAGTFAFAQAKPATDVAGSMSVTARVVAVPAPTGVGVWVMEGTGSVQRKLAAQLVEGHTSASSAGSSSVVAVRAVVMGKVHDVLTNAATTGELLSAMGIAPDANDRVLPSLQAPLHVGSVVRFDVDALIAPSPAVEVALPSTASSPSTGSATGAGMQTGDATWYDPPWSGLTAAHKTLPFGTHVTVTNVDTGASVTVVIDDRGPYAPGRIIDLSPEAFAAIAPLGQGVVHVRITW